MALTLSSQQLKRLPSAFPEAFPSVDAPWTLEREIGRRFAREGDYYRAITAFKRALFLLPKEELLRRQELEFDILLSYVLAQRWAEAKEFLQSTELMRPSPQFAAHRELLLILYEIALQTDNSSQAQLLSTHMLLPDQEALQEGQRLQNRQWSLVQNSDFQQAFQRARKSPEKAALLNALLPGAGYFYVGQPGTAITALIVNGPTLAATITLANHKQYAAAVLVGSLEAGWYIGGIDGASRAARRWNDSIGERLATPLLIQEHLHPLFRLEAAF